MKNFRITITIKLELVVSARPNRAAAASFVNELRRGLSVAELPFVFASTRVRQ